MLSCEHSDVRWSMGTESIRNELISMSEREFFNSLPTFSTNQNHGEGEKKYLYEDKAIRKKKSAQRQTALTFEQHASLVWFHFDEGLKKFFPCAFHAETFKMIKRLFCKAASHISNRSKTKKQDRKPRTEHCSWDRKCKEFK